VRFGGWRAWAELRTRVFVSVAGDLHSFPTTLQVLNCVASTLGISWLVLLWAVLLFTTFHTGSLGSRRRGALGPVEKLTQRDSH
jgi:hypothetical protein